MTMICASCASLEDRAVNAGQRQGAATARVTLPDLPPDCRVEEAHAPLVKGAEAVSVLKRERAQLDKANARVTRCAGNYDSVADAFR